MPPVPVDGHTQLVGLVGWPVEHSMSPAMHNAAFEALGLNWRYIPLPVAPGRVEAAIRGLGALGFRGANVTVPHKQTARHALAHLFGPNSVDRDADAMGAVNTLVTERDSSVRTKLKGHNTDVEGFLGTLLDSGFRAEGTKAVVVGAGGAARAVVFGLMSRGAKSVAILNRTRAHADALASDLHAARPKRPGVPDVAIQPLPLTVETLIESAQAADLLVNATPVGMWPRVDESIWPEDVEMPSALTVFDLICNPMETRLQRQARAAGANTIDGLGMLVRQGALALELWTGMQAPIRLMRTACERSLQT